MTDLSEFEDHIVRHGPRCGIGKLLNQLENDDRPLTAKVKAAVASAFPTDWASFDSRQEEQLLGAFTYALAHPERLKLDVPRLDLAEIGKLEFFTPDMDKFPCLRLAYEAGRKGGQSVAPEQRSFSKNPSLAAEAGRKGGEVTQKAARKSRDDTIADDHDESTGSKT